MPVSLEKEQYIPPTELPQTVETRGMLLEDASKGVGRVALTSEINPWNFNAEHFTSEAGERTHLRTIEIGGMQVETTVPDGVEISITQSGANRLPYVRLGEYDKLANGIYTVAEKGGINTVLSRMDIRQGEDGIKRINSLPNTRPSGTGAEKLMQELGFSYNLFSKYIQVATPELVPTPVSLKEQAAKLGVEIAFFPDDEQIPDVPYLAAVHAGKYPVALGSSEYYGHDISDDHLTAMVLGGDVLRDALAEAVAQPLESGDNDQQRLAADAVDRYTAILRRVINSKGIDSDEQSDLGSDLGRQTLQKIGAELRIPVEKTNEIIVTAQAKAAEYGIAVQPLV